MRYLAAILIAASLLVVGPATAGMRATKCTVTKELVMQERNGMHRTIKREIHRCPGSGKVVGVEWRTKWAPLPAPIPYVTEPRP